MCGLVGIAGNLGLSDESTMKRLFIYDYFRGPDSTGLAVLKNDGTAKMAKIASHPIDFFDTKKFNEILNGYQSSVFLGHNRLATKGLVNGNNAHPFWYDHIIGAHNGTLDKESWKRLENAIGFETDVDSQAVIAAIAKIGIEETVKLMEEGRTSSEGAWALVWIDLKEKKLNFLRNKHRPMWYGYSKDFKKLLWASEWPMLRAAVSMSATKYELFADEDGCNFWEMLPDWWYRFDIDDLKAGGEDRPKPRVKELKGREPAPVAFSAGGTPPFMQDTGNMTWRKTSSMTTGCGSSHGKNSDKLPEVITINGSKALPFGDYMAFDTFDEIAKNGCGWCQGGVDYDEPGVTIYEKSGQILCGDCSGNNGISRIYTDRAELEHYHNKLAC